MAFLDNVGGQLFSKKFWEKFGHILNKDYEEKWNEAWQKTTVFYEWRTNSVIDIKDVFILDTKEQEEELENLILQPVFLMNNDDKAYYLLNFVISNLTYKSDKLVWKKPEYWQSAYGTWKLKTGDCEDFSVLLYKLMRLANIPLFRLRVATGWAKQDDGKFVGHAYVLYLKEADNRWYSLDGTFYSSRSLLAFRTDIPHIDRVEYSDMWWTTNEENSWAQHSLVYLKNGEIVEG